MKLAELSSEKIAGSEFIIPAGALSGEINAGVIAGISADSRKVKPGFVFAALKGSNSDGVDYIPQAIKSGAIAVLTHSEAEISDLAVPVLKVAEPRLALAKLAAKFFSRQPEIMVGVTGTAGKTSVASFTRQIWEYAGYPAASIGTTGVQAPGRDEYGSLTTPDPVALHQLLDDLAQNGVTHGAMEASSHGLDQYRLDGVKLAAGAFTNLGRDHMDYHSDVEDYFSAKMRLFNALLPAGAPAVIFADDPWAKRAEKEAKAAGLDVKLVGHKGDFLALKRLEHERFRQIAEIRHGKENFRIEFPLAGDFQLANALVAAGLAIATGTPPAMAMKALETLKGAPGRLDLVGFSREGAPCYVDYAHKPEALENMLSSLRPFTAGRLICVFGAGGDRDPGKRPIMGEISARCADITIITDDNPRSEDPASIRAAILDAVPDAREIGERDEAISTAVKMLEPGDCLVVAGKGHEIGQTIGDKVHHFSDHEVLAAALVENGGRLDGDTDVPKSNSKLKTKPQSKPQSKTGAR